MELNILIGILLIGTGAFSSGSFAVPFGKVEGWKWESYWLVFSFSAYIILPLLACIIFTPEFLKIIQTTPHKVIVVVFLLGAIYGIGNLSFGLALRYLGLSLGYALSLGLMLAIGTLIPPVLDGHLKLLLSSSKGNYLIFGIIVAIIGIVLSAWAGILKDKTVSADNKRKGILEFNLVKGVMASLLVGVTGSAMALGFEQGMPIAGIAEKSGNDPLFSMMPVYFTFLLGTFLTTIIWCILLGVKNKSLKNYVRANNKTCSYQ